MKRILLILAIFFINLSFVSAKDLYNAAPQQVSILTEVERVEHTLYKENFYRDDIFKRLDRIEKTIYGESSEGNLNNRVIKIKSYLYSKDEQPHDALIKLMENKFFNTEYNSESMSIRLARLEETVFGRSFTGTVDERFKRLAEKIPVLAKTIVVSTDKKKESIENKITIEPPPWVKPTKLDKQKLKTEKLRKEEFFDIKYEESFGDYFSRVAKSKNNETLRWTHFPVLIYIEEPAKKGIEEYAKHAIKLWSKHLYLSITKDKKSADITISWNPDRTCTTRPILTEEKSSRFKVLINIGKYHRSPYLHKIIAHQLGHALGIWGHSRSPLDLMYDFYEVKKDIDFKTAEEAPLKRSIKHAKDAPMVRDLNTLIKIYNSPSVNK